MMRKYLVVQLARFGDLVQTKRLILSLLAEGAAVHLCVDISLFAIAKLVYPQCVIHAISVHANRESKNNPLHVLLENKKVFRSLQAEHFDRVYNLNFSNMAFALARLFAPEKVIGYSMYRGQKSIGHWPSLAIRWTRDRRLNINLIDFWGLYADNPIAPEKVNPPAKAQGGGLGIVLSGRESRRSLPMDVLANIIPILYEKVAGSQIQLFGTQLETLLARKLLRELPLRLQEHTLDLTGKTNWQELYDRLHDLDLLLTPDTGTMHLAAHLGTPILAFFLSSAWCFETGPYGTGHVVHQGLADCAPCLEAATCKNNLQCLTGLSSQKMLRYLATGKKELCPAHLTTFIPYFDQLGLNFSPLTGEDAQSRQRAAFRSFVAIHKKIPVAQCEDAQAQEYARSFYREIDWMLPQKD